jgi:hypothetical protein
MTINLYKNRDIKDFHEYSCDDLDAICARLDRLGAELQAIT